MEKWDLYDEERQKMNKTMVRGEAFEPGTCHIVVHVCLFDPLGEKMLIQRRVSDKESWPGYYDLSAGGSALAGERSRDAAHRETWEELGLDLDFSQSRPRFSLSFGDGFDDIYPVLLEEMIETDALKLQSSEVESVKWATKDEIKKMVMEGSFIPYYPELIDLIFASVRNDQRGCLNLRDLWED